MKLFGPQRQGFTLVEIMFGVMILGVSLIAIQQGIAGCAILNVVNNNRNVAANDANYVLEQIRDLDYDNCTALDFASGCYTFPTFTNLPNETVTHTNTSAGFGLTQVTVTISWTEKTQTKELSIATYFSG